MSSNGDLNKGIKSCLIQDVYRAVQDNKGNIIFNKVKILNLCFVRFDGSDKIYVLNNPTDKRLDNGTKILVETIYGKYDANVVSSIKIQKNMQKI